MLVQSYKKYAVFKGRASRSEYWSFRLFLFVIQLLLTLLALFLSDYFDYEFVGLRDFGLNFIPTPILFVISPILGQIFYSNILTSLFLSFSLLPFYAVSVRRLHDIGKSGWFLLFSPDLFVIPLLLVLSFTNILYELLNFLSYSIVLADMLSFILIILVAVSWLFMLLLWLYFMLRRGDEEQNRFGSPL